MGTVVVRSALDSDWTAIETLLVENALPVAGAAEHRDTYWVAVDGPEIVGTAGVELYGPSALLRSVAVKLARQKGGIGGALLDVVEAATVKVGIGTLYLLTTTAAGYFEARGFVVVTRTEVPEGMRSSAEFRGACPDSATCMRRPLT